MLVEKSDTYQNNLLSLIFFIILWLFHKHLLPLIETNRGRWNWPKFYI